jgi:uncharacterized protein (UPF0335 family)
MAESTTEAATPKPGHNGFDPALLKGYVERIDNLKDEMASAKGSYMKTARECRDAINDVLTEAKDKGIPKKELKAVLKARDYTRKADAAREDLEGDAQDTFDAIAHALGLFADTPLGQAAMQAAQ